MRCLMKVTTLCSNPIVRPQYHLFQIGLVDGGGLKGWSECRACSANRAEFEMSQINHRKRPAAFSVEE